VVERELARKDGQKQDKNDGGLARKSEPDDRKRDASR
jgi:hypothetical protein